MNISELLRKLADVIASAEGDDSGPQSADLSPVKVDHQDNTDTKTGVFVPPLQAKLELLKKSVNVDNVITVGIPNIHMSNNDNTITVSAGRTAFLRFWSTGTTTNDLFCQATYG